MRRRVRSSTWKAYGRPTRSLLLLRCNMYLICSNLHALLKERNAKISYENYMSSYLYDANASDVIQQTPQNPSFHPKSDNLTPLCLRFSLSAMKTTQKKGKGRGKARNEEGKGKGKGREWHTNVESDKCLGLPPKKRLFKVVSLTLTS